MDLFYEASYMTTYLMSQTMNCIIMKKKYVQLNLCTTATLRTISLLSLLTGSHCSKVALCYYNSNLDYVGTVDRWTLVGHGCKLKLIIILMYYFVLQRFCRFDFLFFFRSGLQFEGNRGSIRGLGRRH